MVRRIWKEKLRRMSEDGFFKPREFLSAGELDNLYELLVAARGRLICQSFHTPGNDEAELIPEAVASEV